MARRIYILMQIGHKQLGNERPHFEQHWSLQTPKKKKKWKQKGLACESLRAQWRKQKSLHVYQAEKDVIQRSQRTQRYQKARYQKASSQEGTTWPSYGTSTITTTQRSGAYNYCHRYHCFLTFLELVTRQRNAESGQCDSL